MPEPANSHKMRASNPQPRASNLRTGLILLSVAVVFFGGAIVAQYTGATSIGMSVLGFAIVGFLAVAIGRNVRK